MTEKTATKTGLFHWECDHCGRFLRGTDGVARYCDCVWDESPEGTDDE